MWNPRDAAEVERAARSEDLEETASFDAKADLPPAKKNASVAVDVAAMTGEGGVIVYGVGEDDDGRPSLPAPIALAGVADRVSQIVSTSIAEVPDIQIRELPLIEDSSRGYLLVTVPQSARAPHQVNVKGEGRFYGRDAKGNRVLTEGDIARLYERRERWEISQAQLLARVVADAPLKPVEGRGFIHAFAWPVVQDRSLLERAFTTLGGSNNVHQRLLGWVSSTRLSGTYEPTLQSAQHWGRHGAGVWRLSRASPEELESIAAGTSKRDSTDVASLDLHLDGRIDGFCGRTTDVYGDQKVILEVIVAGAVEAVMAVAHGIYESAGYVGALNVGVEVTGLQGAYSYRRTRTWHGGAPYPVEQYSNFDRVNVAQLTDAPDMTKRLLRHLLEATSNIDGYDPFEQNG